MQSEQLVIQRYKELFGAEPVINTEDLTPRELDAFELLVNSTPKLEGPELPESYQWRKEMWAKCFCYLLHDVEKRQIHHV